MIIQRHIDMGTPEEKVKQLREVFDEICESIGLTDDAIKKTYDECNAGWIERTKEMGVTTIQFEVLFSAIGLDNDGESLPRSGSSITRLLHGPLEIYIIMSLHTAL